LRLGDRAKALLAKLNVATLERSEVIAVFPVIDEKKKGVVALSQRNEIVDNPLGDRVVRQCTRFEGKFILNKRNERNQDA
jgi:hypothetical protein